MRCTESRPVTMSLVTCMQSNSTHNFTCPVSMTWTVHNLLVLVELEKSSQSSWGTHLFGHHPEISTCNMMVIYRWQGLQTDCETPHQLGIRVVPCGFKLLPRALSEHIAPAGACKGVVVKLCCCHAMDKQSDAQAVNVEGGGQRSIAGHLSTMAFRCHHSRQKDGNSAKSPGTCAP